MEDAWVYSFYFDESNIWATIFLLVLIVLWRQGETFILPEL